MIQQKQNNYLYFWKKISQIKLKISENIRSFYNRKVAENRMEQNESHTQSFEHTHDNCIARADIPNVIEIPTWELRDQKNIEDSISLDVTTKRLTFQPRWKKSKVKDSYGWLTSRGFDYILCELNQPHDWLKAISFSAKNRNCFDSAFFRRRREVIRQFKDLRSAKKMSATKCLNVWRAP